jgi:Zn-dependent alcohol dehydrogenase
VPPAPDGVDVAFDVVGDPGTTAFALRRTRNGGRTVVVGVPTAVELLDLEPTEFERRANESTGTMYGPADARVALPLLLEHVREAALQLEPLIAATYSLDDVNQTIEARPDDLPGRVVVTP